MDLACEVSVDGFVQEQYTSGGGQCTRYAWWFGFGSRLSSSPPLARLTHARLFFFPPLCPCPPPPHTRCKPNGELLSLLDVCVDQIAKNMLRYESTQPFGEALPPELVSAVLDSFTKHRALVRLTLESVACCDLERLDVSSCKDVDDGWLAPFADKSLTHVNLASAAVTDAGLLGFTNLGNLQEMDLSACASLEGHGLAALKDSWHLHTLTLSGCRSLQDEHLGHLARLPALVHLRLDGCRFSDRALEAMTPLLPQLKTLSLNHTGARFTKPALTACLSALRECEHLDLGYSVGTVGRETLEVLVRGPTAASLQTLVLDGCRLAGTDLYALGQLTHLRGLSLRGTDIADAGLCQLPPRLEMLDVSYCKGVRRLPAQALPHLCKINLAHSGLRDSDVGSLAEFPALRDVNLDACAIGNGGLATLASLPLVRLNVADTNVSDGALAAVAASFPLLSELSVFYCNITDVGVRHLGGLRHLTKLNLDGRDLTDASCQSLAALTRLTHLILSGRVSDKGLSHLSSLPALTHLDACGGRITDQGLEHLGRLSTLKRLNLSHNTRVSNAGLHHLAPLNDLEVLNLSHTDVAAPGALAPLRKLRGIKVLAVNGCQGFDEATVAELTASLPYLGTVKAAVTGCGRG